MIQALLSYAMQSTMVPMQIFDEVDIICIDFIWDDTELAHKIHPISWEKICTPKKLGGWDCIRCNL